MGTNGSNGKREWSDTHEKVRVKAGFEVDHSPEMREVFWHMTRVSKGMNVLLMGDTGTGKTSAARVINMLLKSDDPSVGPHVESNLASLPKEMLASELFGHKKGAFTGANDARTGRFEFANGGTLMLDEIGEVPLPTQVQLLSAFDEPRMIQRIGTNDQIPLDLVAISGTTKDLPQMVMAQAFDSALYERLSESVIRMPSLAERGPLYVRDLVHSMLKRFANGSKKILEMEPEVMNRIQAMRFSGNARSVQYLLKPMVRDAYKTDAATITERHLDDALAQRENVEAVTHDQEHLGTLAEVEKAHILKILERYEWKVLPASQHLGMARETIYRRLEQWGMAHRVHHAPHIAPETTTPQQTGTDS